MKPGNIQAEDLSIHGFKPEMLRTAPIIHPIIEEEIKWIMPFAVDDCIWDHEDFDLKTAVNFPKVNALVSSSEFNLRALTFARVNALEKISPHKSSLPKPKR